MNNFPPDIAPRSIHVFNSQPQIFETKVELSHQNTDDLDYYVSLHIKECKKVIRSLKKDLIEKRRSLNENKMKYFDIHVLPNLRNF